LVVDLVEQQQVAQEEEMQVETVDTDMVQNKNVILLVMTAE
jgi:hypothetical protein